MHTARGSERSSWTRLSSTVCTHSDTPTTDSPYSSSKWLPAISLNEHHHKKMVKRTGQVHSKINAPREHHCRAAHKIKHTSPLLFSLLPMHQRVKQTITWERRNPASTHQTQCQGKKRREARLVVFEKSSVQLSISALLGYSRSVCRRTLHNCPDIVVKFL